MDEITNFQQIQKKTFKKKSFPDSERSMHS